MKAEKLNQIDVLKNRHTREKWEQYHETREALLKAITTHQKSIEVVNVYNNVSNQSDSWSLTNESMGIFEMEKLAKKLTT